jgi:hypothetical protein
MCKSKFGQAHCEEWFKRSATKFISKYLDIPTIFYKFWKFALFSGILKQLKNVEIPGRSTVLKTGPRLQPTGVANRTWDGGVARSLTTRWQGVAGDLEGGTGEVPGKEEGAGAHRSSGRQCGGANGVGQRCSTVVGLLWWSSMRVDGSYSSRETRG